jgi:transcriptional regulator with XRE-family HTH domain
MLRELREKAGLTQEALARLAGLSTFTVSKLEQGGVDPSWSTVKKLARALGVSVAAFEGGRPADVPPETPRPRRPRKDR